MEYSLTIKKREEKGKEQAKKLRRAGWIPAVVYGKGEDTTLVMVPEKEAELFVQRTYGESVLVNISIDKQNKRVILKDVARNTISGKIMHIDFQIVHKGEKIHAEVPVLLTGTAKGVKEGGVLEQVLREIEVLSIPSKLPPHIEIDISDMEMGQSIKVADIEKKDIEILTNPDEVIVTVLHPRKEVKIVEEVPEETTEEETEETESGTGKE